MTTLLLVGATGLVGASALQQALEDPRVERVVAPTRRALPPRPRLENPVVDFDHLPEEAPWWKADAVVCTLGTTIRKAGSQAAFRRVDFEYPLAVARLARRHGAGAFVLTSANGADARSRIFYNRTKGEIEEALRGCGYPSLTLVRPSLLDGERDESRPLERAAIRLFRVLRPVLPRRYRAVPAPAVARVLLDAALAARPGVHVVESDAIT